MLTMINSSAARPANCIAKNSALLRRPGSRPLCVRDYRFALAFPFPCPEQGSCSADDGQRDHGPQNGSVVLPEKSEDLFAVHRPQPRQQPVADGARQSHSHQKIPFRIFQRARHEKKRREGYWRRQQRRYKETPETISFKQTINPVSFFL